MDTATSSNRSLGFEYARYQHNPTYCSYYLDAIDNYINFGDILDTILSGATPAFSIRSILKRNSIGSTQTIFGKYNVTGNQRQILAQFQADNTIDFVFSTDGTAEAVVSTTGTFTSLDWADVILTFDGAQSGINKIKVYVGGLPVGITLASGTLGAIFDSTSLLQWGSFSSGSDLLDGYINAFGITSDIITPQEALDLYEGGNPHSLSDICDNIELDCIIDNDTFGGTNFTVIDKSVNGTNGTTVNMDAIDKDCNENPY